MSSATVLPRRSLHDDEEAKRHRANPLNTRIIYQNITTLKSPPINSAGYSTYTIQIFSPTHHPLLIIESNPNGSPLTLGTSTERGGQLTVFSCITGTTDVGKTTWHRIDLGTKSAAV